MKILLTGATGFVGPYLQDICASIQLIARGGTPIDLRDATAVTTAVAEAPCDAVVHLAAQSFVPRSFADPLETFEINFIGTFNLLNALKAAGFRGRFLYVGTADVYGLAEEKYLPLTESLLPRPRNPYAVSKLAAEALCYQWSQTEQFEIMMARPFNHTGPGQSADFVLPSLAKQIAERARSGSREPILAGDIDVTRDFSDVRDVVRAYLRLLDTGGNGEIYNICSGVESSVRDSLNILQSLAGVQLDTITDVTRFRPSEQRRSVGSFSKIHRETGWEPTIPLRQTLNDLLIYWSNCIA